MPSTRITIRLSSELAARLATHTGPGSHMADIVRQALEAYLGGEAPQRLPQADLAATLSAISAKLEVVEQRLATLEAASATDSQRETMRPTPPQQPPPPPGTYDPDAASVRIQDLQAQGYSLRQIAAQLTTEGIPTRRGGPWNPSSVRYLLKTYGP